MSVTPDTFAYNQPCFLVDGEIMGYQCPHPAIEGKQFGRDFSLVSRIWSPTVVMLPLALVGTILQM